MHLLTAQAGRIDEGDEAVDLEQSPGDIVILSSADTELAALTRVNRETSEGAPTLRLANFMQLKHPYSVDLYCETVLAKAKLIILRLLGGPTYWDYGFGEVQALARREKIKLVTLPGEANWSESYDELSTVPLEDAQALWQYFVQGGQINYQNALQFSHALLDQAEKPLPAKPLLKAGLYSPNHGICGLSDLKRDWADAKRPVAAFVFYRALVQANTLGHVDTFIEELDATGLNALPIFVASLKDAESAAFLETIFAKAPPDIVLNTSAFAASKSGISHQPTPLDKPGMPVLQVILSGAARDAWQESDRGLSIRDLSMHVVLPEIDGRLLTRAVSFKEQKQRDPGTDYAPVDFVADRERCQFVARQAASWVRLQKEAPANRKIALILANYPNKDGRIANGVGLDTPASAISVINAMRDQGYQVGSAPASSDDLMKLLLAGQTNALASTRQITDPVLLDVEKYQAYFESLPQIARDKILERWGAPDEDPFVTKGCFSLAVRRFGNVTLVIQPARGYNIDPKETYHDPALPPPHNYLALYFWLREDEGIYAAIHLGKHGNLEWLPGKALALSQDCFPEIALGTIPNIYPFIVNDPGEGSQAKRRSSAVIIDHLTPPLTRAESYGIQSELEALIDEYYLASGVDPRRMKYLETEIVQLAQSSGLDKDLNTSRDEETAVTLQKLDAHLCDLKELQIRDGLHILGQSPEAAQQSDLLAAIARVPRGNGVEQQSLQRAIAKDLDLHFNPLDCDYAENWNGPRPDCLKAVSDETWRITGDTVERIELFASLSLSEGLPEGIDWKETQPVLDALHLQIQPDLEKSGANEIASVMAALNGKFVMPGPSGAPSRGRPDVLPTGRNFYSVDVRSVPTETAWQLGKLSAERLVERHFQDEGEWLRALVLSVWGTANMRTGGDDIAQAMALIGAKPVWEKQSGRVTGFEVISLSDLKRPRVDVTLRISGFFRDAFPQQIDLFDSSVRAIADLDEPVEMNPIAEAFGQEAGQTHHKTRVFGSAPGAYGAGLQALIDERIWTERSDFAESFLTWGSYAYGGGNEGLAAREEFSTRLTKTDAVVQNQDNREHDLLDSDDYYQFEGGLAATVETLKGAAPKSYHNDHARPENPVIRTLNEEIARVVRGRAANPKWIAGVMRHGYKGAFEMAATLDYLFAFSATTEAVDDHHFDQLYEAYLGDETVRDFIEEANPAALQEMAERFLEAADRGLWRPRRNSVYDELNSLRQSKNKGLAP